jgi:GTPase SAR1 family protein
VVQQEIVSAQREDFTVHKLLLLGAGGSGKSTFFKQLKIIHGDGHTPREKEGYKRQVFGQMVDNMQILIRQCRMLASSITAGGDDEIGDDSDDDDEYLDDVEDPMFSIRAGLTAAQLVKYRIDEDYEDAAKHIDSLTNTSVMDEKIAECLKVLWSDCEAIRLMFEFRNKICVPDSTSYFYDSVERISRGDYLPSDEDILRVRYRTTGMTEKEFVINEARFRVHDVGGQRNERKKWIHFFDSVTAVLFVISLSCYDEVPFEDVTDLDADLRSANNMIESLTVFDEVLGESCFKKVGFILFLNKADVMAVKIKEVPITVAFPEYTGAQTFQPSVDYIRDAFLAKNTLKTRDMFAHVTTATDSENVTRVFNNVQEMVVNWSLKAAGLV